MLKKIATALVAFGAIAIATPAVMACPHGDKEKTEDAAPKTADKEKSKSKPTPKKTDKKEDKKDTAKDGDKVSVK
jgi:hypothetical protein